MHQDPQRTTEGYPEVEAGLPKAQINLALWLYAAHETEPHGIQVFTRPLSERLASEDPAAPIAVLVATDMFTGLVLAAEVAPATTAEALGFALRVWRSHFEPMYILCDHAPSRFKADHQEPLCAKGGGRG